MPLVAGDSLLGGVLPELRRAMLPSLLRWADEHGDVFRARAAHQTIVVLRHPVDVERVLTTNHRNYTKNTRGYEVLRQLLGNGLLTSEGDFWLRQRRLMQPVFSREHVHGYARQMTDATLRTLMDWESTMALRGTVDICAEMMKLTLRIASTTLLSRDISDEAKDVGQALAVVLEAANHRILHPLTMPEWVPTQDNRRYQDAANVLFRVVDETIAARRQHGAGNDLLGTIMAARDESTGEHMTERQLRDETLTMLLAGHETTAMLLTWTFYLLSMHPAVEARVMEELDAVLGGRIPTLMDLTKLTYLDRVLKEVLRLYPPAWMLARYAEADDDVTLGRVRKGEFVFVGPWMTHRHPAFFENPEGFDPDRFLPERIKGLHKFAYFPFSAGQRKCIGDQFAVMEGMLVLATLLQRVRPSLVSGQTVELEPLITLRPKGGIRMRLDRTHRAALTVAPPAPSAAGCPFHHGATAH